MTWYQVTTGWGGVKIDPREVVKATDKMVVTERKDDRGRRTEYRHLIESSGGKWFDNLEDAVVYAKQKADEAVESARSRLERVGRERENLLVSVSDLRKAAAKAD